MSSDPIVVGTDGSATAERAVDKAAELALALGAPVHLVSAYSFGSGTWSGAATSMGMPPIADYETWHQAAQDVVDSSSARVRPHGVQVVTHVCEGEPAEVLINVAAKEHAQMIVVGNRGMSGARRVLGSVPNHVSHHARCGVLIVPTS